MRLYSLINCFVIITLLICEVPIDVFAKPKQGNNQVVEATIKQEDDLNEKLQTSIEKNDALDIEIEKSRYKFVETAYNEVGNIGGEKYWSWYGFKNHVSWCAIFVSWCGEQNGLIEKNVIPKFASVSYGQAWFVANNEWLWPNESPKPGMIIFFDFANRQLENIQDGIPDHVGIVLKVQDDCIYCIEGNRLDKCEETVYDINSRYIFGYGNPKY